MDRVVHRRAVGGVGVAVAVVVEVVAVGVVVPVQVVELVGQGAVAVGVLVVAGLHGAGVDELVQVLAVAGVGVAVAVVVQVDAVGLGVTVVVVEAVHQVAVAVGVDRVAGLGGVGEDGVVGVVAVGVVGVVVAVAVEGADDDRGGAIVQAGGLGGGVGLGLHDDVVAQQGDVQGVDAAEPGVPEQLDGDEVGGGARVPGEGRQGVGGHREQLHPGGERQRGVVHTHQRRVGRRPAAAAVVGPEGDRGQQVTGVEGAQGPGAVLEQDGDRRQLQIEVGVVAPVLQRQAEHGLLGLLDDLAGGHVLGGGAHPLQVVAPPPGAHVAAAGVPGHVDVPVAVQVGQRQAGRIAGAGQVLGP